MLFIGIKRDKKWLKRSKHQKKQRVIEVNPKVWTKNFGVYFMRKKHDHQALLKYMHMLEDGYSIKHIEDNYG
ncbi:MAG: hypothetical protein IJX41_06065, partial [Bacteroidaceae bacterium]|nr:hypothetical protein [Bacteroidaceae bacterium]